MVKINPEDTIYMCILVNSDLKMGKGKIGAQCAHSACKVVLFMERLEPELAMVNRYKEWYDKWLVGDYAKIVFKATEEQMRKIIEDPPAPIAYTYDAGRTQIPEGSLTTIAFYPMPKSERPKFLNDLKLL